VSFNFTVSLKDGEVDEAMDFYDTNSMSEIRDAVRDDMKDLWKDEVLDD